MIFPPISLWNAVFEAASPPAKAGGLSLSKNPGFQCAKAGVLLQFGR